MNAFSKATAVIFGGVAFATLFADGVKIGRAQAADLSGPPPVSAKDDYAPAARVNPFYIGIRGGFNFSSDTSFDFSGFNVSNTYEKPGYSVSGMAGVQLDEIGLRGFRGELELGYLSNDIKSHTLNGFGQFNGANAFGRTSATYGLASLYYDFNAGGLLRPFVGAGGGFADVNFHRHGIAGLGTVANDSSTSYAWHASAGLSYALGAKTDLELGYRFLQVPNFDLSAVDGSKSSSRLDEQQILVGIRQRF